MDVIGKFENARKVMQEFENSQLVLETRKQHVKLAPKFIGNVRDGVNQQLTTLLSHPDKILDGFPLAYSNVRVLQKMGKMISDQTCVHLDIEADFIMFKPSVGCRLNGKVNKIAKRHIGCLVHDHFNAWLMHTSSTEKVAADRLMGAEIEFTVQDISTNRNVLSIKGKFEKFLSPSLQKNNIVAMKPKESKQKTPKKRKKTDNMTAVTADATPDKNATESEENDIVIKKKKRRKSVSEISQAGPVLEKATESNITVNTEVDEEQPVKLKKKHKKDKRKSAEVNDTVVCGSGNVNDSIASVTSCEPLFTSTQIEDINNNKDKLKDKKHKKKKKHEKIAENDESETNQVNSVENDRVDNTGSGAGNEDTVSIQDKAKNRKRQHVDNKFTKLKDSLHDDLDVPSPVKKLKKHKKLVIDTDFDISADFEDSSKHGKKEKRKKHKHKEN